MDRARLGFPGSLPTRPWTQRREQCESTRQREPEAGLGKGARVGRVGRVREPELVEHLGLELQHLGPLPPAASRRPLAAS